MYSLKNDYSEGAHPRILEALVKTNMEQTVGYGLDEYSGKAKELIKEFSRKYKCRCSFFSRRNTDKSDSNCSFSKAISGSNSS